MYANSRPRASSSQAGILKSPHTGTLYSEYTRTLTFENAAAGRHSEKSSLYSECTRALTFENAHVIAGRHSNIFFSSVAKDDILPRTGLQSVFFLFS